MWLNKMTRTIPLLELEFSRDRNADKTQPETTMELKK